MADPENTIIMETTKGRVVIELRPDLAPGHVERIKTLSRQGFYDGVVFHRVIDGFMAQTGDPTGTGSGGPGYTIQDEPVTTQYSRGTVAMARTQAPNSVGSQFFIVLDDGARDSLAAANTYQIIGSVAEGMETADKIAAAADAELPSDPVAMNDVSVSNP